MSSGQHELRERRASAQIEEHGAEAEVDSMESTQARATTSRRSAFPANDSARTRDEDIGLCNMVMTRFLSAVTSGC